MLWLATIGYEGASVEDFIATLRQAEVRTLIDIRQVPASRRTGFSKAALREVVEAKGVRYIHLIGLGDPKEGRAAAQNGRFADFRRIFARHLASAPAQADLELVVEIAQNGGACLLCYERQPDLCHRSLVADALGQRISVEIRHLGVRAGLARNDRLRSRTGLGAGKGAAACQ
jgi:uncharacterized protein (DUF488 family)